jgi:hypothetical protein
VHDAPSNNAKVGHAKVIAKVNGAKVVGEVFDDGVFYLHY